MQGFNNRSEVLNNKEPQEFENIDMVLEYPLPETSMRLIGLLRSNKLSRLNDLLKADLYSDDCKDVTEQINIINDVLKNNGVLSLLQQKIEKWNENVQKMKDVDAHGDEERIYNECRKKCLIYPFVQKHQEMKRLIESYEKTIEESNIMKINVYHAYAQKEFEDYFFHLLLKQNFNPRLKKDSKALKEIMTLGLTQTRHLITDIDIIDFSSNILLLEENKKTLKICYKYRPESSLTNLKRNKYVKENENLKNEIESLIFRNKKLASF